MSKRSKTKLNESQWQKLHASHVTKLNTNTYICVIAVVVVVVVVVTVVVVAGTLSE